MSSDHGHATSDDHGHGPTVPESELIKESSPQDWLLILAAAAVMCSLVWYGWQWSATPVPVEGKGHEEHHEATGAAQPATEAVAEPDSSKEASREHPTGESH